MIYLASHDPLTGLLNRRAYNSLAEKAIAKAKRDQTGVALITVDLDFFKTINDVHGHADGDAVLQQVAEVLTSSFGTAAIVGGLAGMSSRWCCPGTRRLTRNKLRPYS